MCDSIIFFVPKNKTYRLSDVIDTLDCVYGNITKTTIWNDENDKVWYSVNIKWKQSTEEINTFKANLFDNTATIAVNHSTNSNHSYYYDVQIFSQKIWYYYTYEQQCNILREKINYLENENNILKSNLV